MVLENSIFRCLSGGNLRMLIYFEIDAHLTIAFPSRLLPQGEWFSVSRRSAEKTAVIRANHRRYRSTDRSGGYKRRCQSQGAHRVRDRILQPGSKSVKTYFQAVRILFPDALSACQKECYTLPPPGKPITSKTHSALWETESINRQSIKIYIAISHTSVKISVKRLTTLSISV